MISHMINNSINDFVVLILCNKKGIQIHNKSIELKKLIIEKFNKCISIFELDTNEYIHTALQYYVSELPTLLFFKKGKFIIKIDSNDKNLNYKLNNL